jgi:hypothetical protein
MRYLGLLFSFALISTPALARKHQKHPQQHAQREPEPAPAPPPREVEAPRPVAPVAGPAVSQSDDDEVPGKKHKK